VGGVGWGQTMAGVGLGGVREMSMGSMGESRIGHGWMQLSDYKTTHGVSISLRIQND